MNRLEASETTVAAFIENIQSSKLNDYIIIIILTCIYLYISGSSREEAKKNFQAVKCAWDLVKNNLSEYSMILIVWVVLLF